MGSADSRLRELYRGLGAEVLDNIVALGILGVFLVISFDYSGPVGQFPRVFVTAAVVLMVINLAINLAPDPYRTSLEVFTQGVTDMAVTDDEGLLTSEAEDHEPKDDGNPVLRGVGMIGILVGSGRLRVSNSARRVRDHLSLR